MLSHLMQLKAVVCLELATSETTVPNQTSKEWKAVAGLVKALEPMTLTTKDLMGHKYITLSSVVPLLNGTQMDLNECIAADDDTSEFARNLLKSMRTRFPGQDKQKEYVLQLPVTQGLRTSLVVKCSRKQGLWSLQEKELQGSPEGAPSDLTEVQWPRRGSTVSGGGGTYRGLTPLPANRAVVLQSPNLPRNERPFCLWCSYSDLERSVSRSGLWIYSFCNSGASFCTNVE